MAYPTHSTTASRRAILGAFLAAPAAFTVGTAAAAITSISPELAGLIEAHRQADAALNRWYAEVFNPAVEKHTAEHYAHKAKTDAVPHAIESGGMNLGGNSVTFSSEAHAITGRRSAEIYIQLDNEQPNRGLDWDMTRDAAHRFIAADDARKAALAALGDAPLCPMTREVEDQACAPVYEAGKRISAFPARTLADLQAKLAWIDGDHGMDGEDLLPLMIADVARIISGEA
jgi:alpha-D-ribose 1-methylphosphonate 5-triphosphate synthase subunit PhnG